MRQLAEASPHFCVAEEPLRRFALTQAPNLFDPENLEKELETLRGTAQAAREEMERGFAGLNNRAWVDLWGVLEDTIRLFLVNWLANKPEARFAATGRMKVNLGEYDAFDEEEKLHFIVERLFREAGGKGAARFENLLKPFGLSGPVDKQPEPYVGDGKVYGRTQTLLDGQCLRNALVHAGA